MNAKPNDSRVVAPDSPFEVRSSCHLSITGTDTRISSPRRPAENGQADSLLPKDAITRKQLVEVLALMAKNHLERQEAAINTTSEIKQRSHEDEQIIKSETDRSAHER